VIDQRLVDALEPLRADYEGRAIPAVFVPGAVSIERAAALRDRVATASRERFDLAHHGRFERTSEVRDAELETSLREFAEHFTRARLVIVSTTWFVMRHGDYALARADDAMRAAGAPSSIELTLDVSPGASGEADIVYARLDGSIVFAAPQEPRGLAIVERAAGVRRYERYLTHKVGDLAVTRMRMRLERV
jgi:hypothetical protein